MFFRRVLALFALLATAGACTPGNNTPQTADSGPQGMPPELAREVGAIYVSPTLQSFVDRVGQRVVSSSNLPGSYHFLVLDDPVPNAHAISAGYVFVTRGLLAVIDDEAELAAAFGHELGHLTRKHAAQRERVRRAVTEAAVSAATASGSVTVGRSVAREGLLALRRYSRDQELEADRVGVGLISRAGYRGDAMATLIDKLEFENRLENELMGLAADAGERNAFATHPDPDERLLALKELPTAAQPGESGREAYLAAVDGMSVDDSPEEGFVRGPSFLHPIMRFAFSAPPDFTLFNDHDGVLGVGRDRSLLYFSCTDETVKGSLADWMRNELKPTPTGIEATTIGGAEAAIGARPRGSDVGLQQIRYVLIRRGTGICYFNLMSSGPDRDRRIDALVQSVRSFHELSDREVAALRPYRLRVVPTAGTTPAALAQRLPYADHRMLRLMTLNGVEQPAAVLNRPQAKIVE